MVSSVSSSSSMPWPVSRAAIDQFRIAAPFGWLQAGRDQLAVDAIEIDAGQIDLVQRHDDRHSRGAGMTDRFFGLRHNAVVGRHDQHRDVGDVGAAVLASP